MTGKTKILNALIKPKSASHFILMPPYGCALLSTLVTIACTKVDKNRIDNPQNNKPPSSPPAVSTTQEPTKSPGNSDSAQQPLHSTETLAGIKESKALCGMAKGQRNADTSTQRQVRLATFNMYGAFSSSLDSLDVRIPMMVNNLSDVQADVIGIQEAEDLDPAGRTIEQLSKTMAEKTGETWYWCFFRSNPSVRLEADVNIGGGGPLALGYSSLIEQNTKKLGQRSWFMGDAILSRLPFGSAGARRISPRVFSEEAACQTTQCKDWARGESRVVVRAEIRLNGRSIHFFNSHFYTNITSESRKSQTQQFSEINAYVNDVFKKKNAPVAVTCD